MACAMLREFRRFSSERVVARSSCEYSNAGHLGASLGGFWAVKFFVHYSKAGGKLYK